MLLELHDRRVDLAASEVRHGPDRKRLTARERELLWYLAEHAGEVVSQKELLEQVWGYASGIRSRTVQVTVQRLRTRLEATPSEPRYLKTVYGIGYRLDISTTQRAPTRLLRAQRRAERP